MGNREAELPHVDMPPLTIRYIDADELIRHVQSKDFGSSSVARNFDCRKSDVISAVNGMMNPEYYSNRRVTSITVDYLPTHEIYAYQLRDNPEYIAKIATRETLEAALRAQEKNGGF